jgi:hypothetical protein
MTQNLRSLFEGTVEPLLDAMRCRDKLLEHERAQAELEKAVADHLDELQATQAALNASKEGTWAHRSAAGTIERVTRELADQRRRLAAAEKAIPALRPEAERFMQAPTVATAWGELEAPVLAGDGGDVGEGPPSVAPLPPPPPPQQRSSLATLLLEHLDPTTAVLDFLGPASAHAGVGTAARGLRTAVKGALGSLVVFVQESGPFPRLAHYPRLTRLAVRRWYFRPTIDWVAAAQAAGLAGRRGFLAIDNDDVWGGYQAVEQGIRQVNRLVATEWPRLRVLDVNDQLDHLLTSLLRRRDCHFPRLEALAVQSLTEDRAASLLSVLDRGALPALATVAQPTKCGSIVHVWTCADAKRQRVLTLLPGTDRIWIQDDSSAFDLGPFSDFIRAGRFPNLK